LFSFYPFHALVTNKSNVPVLNITPFPPIYSSSLPPTVTLRLTFCKSTLLTSPRSLRRMSKDRSKTLRTTAFNFWGPVSCKDTRHSQPDQRPWVAGSTAVMGQWYNMHSTELVNGLETIGIM